MKELDEVGFFRRGFRGWDAVDAVVCVGGAPCLDESPESVVWGEVGVFGQRLFGDRAAGVAAMEQPSLDADTVVCHAGYGCNGVFHDLKRDGADEVLGNLDFIFHGISIQRNRRKGRRRGGRIDSREEEVELRFQRYGRDQIYRRRPRHEYKLEKFAYDHLYCWQFQKPPLTI